MKKLSMEIVNPNAAGIDIGSRFHMAAVNQNVEDVKEFGVYTEDYEAMIIWFYSAQSFPNKFRTSKAMCLRWLFV
jgi:transposase